MGFAPKISPEKFKAPFTSAEGWGTFSQEKTDHSFTARIKVKHGRLALSKLFFELDKNQKEGKVEVVLNNKMIPSKIIQNGTACEVSMNELVLVNADQTITVKIS
jgi:hypothetical protein